MSDERRPVHQTTTDKEVGGNLPETYGEPNGPKPPHFKILPKEEIDAHRGQTRPEPADAVERDRDGFHSGITTPEEQQAEMGPNPTTDKW